MIVILQEHCAVLDFPSFWLLIRVSWFPCLSNFVTLWSRWLPTWRSTSFVIYWKLFCGGWTFRVVSCILSGDIMPARSLLCIMWGHVLMSKKRAYILYLGFYNTFFDNQVDILLACYLSKNPCGYPEESFEPDAFQSQMNYFFSS